MSAISSLLLLLCFCFIACDARRFHHSNTKENEKLNIQARVYVQPDRKTSIQNATGDGKEESSRFKKEKVHSTPESESVDSVAWRVPHKKRGEPEPGFNLDYLPPKTHPPVHN